MWLLFDQNHVLTSYGGAWPVVEEESIVYILDYVTARWNNSADAAWPEGWRAGRSVSFPCCWLLHHVLIVTVWVNLTSAAPLNNAGIHINRSISSWVICFWVWVCISVVHHTACMTLSGSIQMLHCPNNNPWHDVRGEKSLPFYFRWAKTPLCLKGCISGLDKSWRILVPTIILLSVFVRWGLCLCLKPLFCFQL